MSSEFWAAVIGAIVGALAGGGISALLQHWEYNRAKKDSDKALAHSLFFKLYAIHSDLDRFRCYIRGETKFGEKAGLTVGWQSLKPLANTPPKLQFTADEMSFLLSLKDFKLFNDVHSLDRVHGSTIDIFNLYASRRMEMTSLLPTQMQGMIGYADLTRLAPEVAARIPALDAELQSLCTSLTERADLDADEAWRTLGAYNGLLFSVLGHRFVIEKIDT